MWVNYKTYERLADMVPFRGISDYEYGDRLFFELGRKKNINKSSYENNWIRTGRFKEISDPETYIAEDKMMKDLGYLEHHNIMIIKKTKR